MKNLKRHLVTFCFGTGLTLIVAGLYPFIAPASIANAQDVPAATPEAAATEAAQPAAEPLPGDNGYCMVCHNQPWRAVTLQDGYILNLFVDPQVIANSVHGLQNEDGAMGCVDCHGEDSFPHNGPTPNSARVYTIGAVSMCTSCHEQEASDLATGLHEQAIMAGNLEAAVCTDCHGAHDIQPSTNRPQLVAGVCGDCHVRTYEEWRSSPHVNVGPLGCAKCHSPHSQELRVGDVNELCTNCHKAPGDIYIHEQHINSTAFEVTCADCHMYREPATGEVELVAVEFQPTGHSMELDARPCNSCHEQLEASGQWTEIAASVDDRILSERDALQARLTDLENQMVEAETTTTTSFIQLTQGLIIGLGIGITLAVILIPRIIRGNRRKEEPTHE